MRFLATLPVMAFGGLLSASAADVRPGQWQSTGEVMSIEAPGLPANMIDMMRGQKHEFSYCLTQAEVDDGPQAMFDQSDGKCEYTEFSMANGRLDAKATCRNPMGNMMMHMTGTYTATSYESENRMSIASPQGTMKIHARQSGKRVGACTE